MSINRNVLVLTALSLLALSPGTSRANAAVDPVTAMSSENAIVVTGGVGLDERIEMLASAPRYELLVSFAEHADGALLGNVDVTLAGPALKRPMQLRTNGPLLLAELPTGHYVITAHVAGWKDRVHALDIQRYHHQRLYVTFVPETSTH